MGARKSDVRHRNNLRACREAAGKSQRQLAAIMGVSEKSVSAWETGRVEMKADHLLALSNWLGCTPNDLLGYDGDARVVRRFTRGWRRTCVTPSRRSWTHRRSRGARSRRDTSV